MDWRIPDREVKLNTLFIMNRKCVLLLLVPERVYRAPGSGCFGIGIRSEVKSVGQKKDMFNICTRATHLLTIKDIRRDLTM